MGATTLTEEHIILLPGTSKVCIPAHRFLHSQRRLIDGLVKDVLGQDIIEPINSPRNFPLLLVQTKGGTHRPGGDYRQLSNCCRPERYPLPVLQDVVVMSIGPPNIIFSTLDFHHLGLLESPLGRRISRVNCFQYTMWSLLLQKDTMEHLPSNASSIQYLWTFLVMSLFTLMT